MIAHIIAVLLGVAIGIVVSNAADWLLPEEAEDEHEEP